MTGKPRTECGILPHHAVWNTQRTKICVVFDASAKQEVISLNTCLLKGPDYLPNICGVLLRFRRKRIPVSVDTERMYHQVKVKREDRSALRFLWRPPGSKRPPETFEMQVHVFGATSSPRVCMYALRRAALDHQADYPGALGRMSNIYVDNWLKSLDAIGEARGAC
ncbi:hypothetical protein M514_08694 [Trichuris suis]|uniref:Reverse transcriptase domain-containing protein n=1 Tax=Trichuris suis TaxID=68888 RepID=A0A085LZS1_9BILA|nr:hypothetical protein M513_08694 [Trichuris suis]KFD62354.1 hypothetical protein M514_08694 [Trichuris suis]KHJ41628.1 hypothetical protein D918_08275 [Trichuris suis]